MRRTALIAVLVAAAGCGGGDEGGEGGKEASGLLDRGFSTDVKSGVATLDLEVDLRGAAGLGGPLQLTLEGPFEATGDDPTDMPNLDMEVRASGAGREFAGRVVLTRDNAWVEYEGTTYEIGEEAWARLLQAVEEQSRGEPQTFAEAGIDPLDWIDDPELDGEDRVAGVSARKVRGTLDVKALLRDAGEVGAGVSEDDLGAVDDVLEDVGFEAWIGPDEIWRRVVADTEFDVPEEERDSMGGLAGGSVSFRLELEEPNEPVEIDGLGEGRPIEELMRRLGIPPEALLGPGFAQPAPG